jgi:hypothetical protein
MCRLDFMAGNHSASAVSAAEALLTDAVPVQADRFQGTIVPALAYKSRREIL